MQILKNELRADSTTMGELCHLNMINIKDMIPSLSIPYILLQLYQFKGIVHLNLASGFLTKIPRKR